MAKPRKSNRRELWQYFWSFQKYYTLHEITISEAYWEYLFIDKKSDLESLRLNIISIVFMEEVSENTAPSISLHQEG